MHRRWLRPSCVSQTIRKAVTDILASLRGSEGAPVPGKDRRSTSRDRVRSDLASLPTDELGRLVQTLEEEMKEAASSTRIEQQKNAALEGGESGEEDGGFRRRPRRDAEPAPVTEAIPEV